MYNWNNWTSPFEWWAGSAEREEMAVLCNVSPNVGKKTYTFLPHQSALDNLNWEKHSWQLCQAWWRRNLSENSPKVKPAIYCVWLSIVIDLYFIFINILPSNASVLINYVPKKRTHLKVFLQCNAKCKLQPECRCSRDAKKKPSIVTVHTFRNTHAHVKCSRKLARPKADLRSTSAASDPCRC